jgi:hypothetical protein
MPTVTGDVVISRISGAPHCLVWRVIHDGEQAADQRADVGPFSDMGAALSIVRAMRANRPEGTIFVAEHAALTWTKVAD